MKKTFFYVISIFLIAGLISCNKKANTVAPSVSAELWQWPDSVENMLIDIPDSISKRVMSDSTYSMMDYLPPGKREFYMSVMKIIYKYHTVENNRDVFSMSRDEFLKTGIPEAYYDWILSGIDDYNDFMSKHPEGSYNAEEEAETWREELRKAFPGIDK